MNNSVAKKFGRRRAGTWGRPRRGRKTASSRAVRLARKLEVYKDVHNG